MFTISELLHQINDAFQLSEKEENMPQAIANTLIDVETGTILEYLHLMQHSNLNIKKYGPFQQLMN